MKKVVKFGGSSLANAEQFKKVGDIIRSEESRRYVVPSAPGKRYSGDTKVTDLLYACYDKAAAGADFTGILNEIKERFMRSSRVWRLSFPSRKSSVRSKLISEHRQAQSTQHPEESF